MLRLMEMNILILFDFIRSVFICFNRWQRRNMGVFTLSFLANISFIEQTCFFNLIFN